MPILALLFLSPLVGEYLLGNIPLGQLPALPFLVPMYGCGALLVREAGRRAGGGWPAILLLGAAYGLAEAGLFDGSLFNPSYEDLDFSSGYSDALGFSPANALHFVVGHAVWSITIPIFLVEVFTSRRRQPWLGPIGLGVTFVVFVLGGLLIQFDSRGRGDFRTSAAQCAGILVVAGLLIGAAFMSTRCPEWLTSARARWRAPRPWLAGLVAFVLASAFFISEGVLVGVGVIGVAVVAVGWLSRSVGWGPRHRLAVAAGALLTYAWGAIAVGSFTGYDDVLSRVGNGLFALGAVALLIAARRAILRPSAPAVRRSPAES